MTILILVRHGETDWNRARRIQGAVDNPLNAIGRAQASRIAADLRAELDLRRPIVVVTSDLSRAREIGEIISRMLDVEVDGIFPALRERDFGEAEGLDLDVFAARWGEANGDVIPGAETWVRLRTRAVCALRAIVSDVQGRPDCADATIVVVSHGAVIRALIDHATNGEMPGPGERLANGSTHRLSFDGQHMSLLSYTVEDV